MNIKILQAFIQEFGDMDIDKDFEALREYKKLKELIYMIRDLKKSLNAHLKVSINHKENYNNNLLHAIDNGDKILSNLYRREVSFYEGREQLINTLLEEIEILEQKEQEEFELALSEAPYIYERPIEVQI